MAVQHLIVKILAAFATKIILMKMKLHHWVAILSTIITLLALKSGLREATIAALFAENRSENSDDHELILLMK